MLADPRIFAVVALPFLLVALWECRRRDPVARDRRSMARSQRARAAMARDITREVRRGW